VHFLQLGEADENRPMGNTKILLLHYKKQAS
jgi:hypothetical protein